MTPTDDEDLQWKKRFEAFALVRLSGLIFLFGGIMVALKNPFGDEYPIIGAILALSGAADLIFGPKMLKKVWEEKDR
ncbi:hypothetical protein [Sphingomicrobium aestuariivivum]|uniref:hypothetical protein n=1 Tax=Sphingomicrobium aestuariivivum TaxID=1582356 RepID=UPI001FD70AC4|nr:hypothetical protein [Sphingomicrobium aestuariivivum]MCJ8191518.1 hypothetical protein [Sphingomicrobium aestuariivivum]